jgi:hypothetical protein
MDHAIMDRAVFISLSSGQTLKFECPMTHKLILLTFTAKIEKTTDFTKEELEIAQDADDLRNDQWNLEEGHKDDFKD